MRESVTQKTAWRKRLSMSLSDDERDWWLNQAKENVEVMDDDDFDAFLAALDTAPVADDILYDKFGETLDVWPQEDE